MAARDRLAEVSGLILASIFRPAGRAAGLADSRPRRADHINVRTGPATAVISASTCRQPSASERRSMRSFSVCIPELSAPGRRACGRVPSWIQGSVSDSDRGTGIFGAR